MGNKKMKKKKGNSGATKERKQLVDFLVTHKESIAIILGVCVSLYPILNSFYKILYRIECEKFYALPGKYFDANIDNRLLYLGCIIILVFISIAPALMKRYYEKKGNLTKAYLLDAAFLSIIIGVEIGLLNVYNLIEIMKQTYKTNRFYGFINNFLNNNSYITIIVIIILGTISVLGITLLKEIKSVRWKWINNLVCAVLYVSLGISVLLLLYGTMFKLSISIEYKTKYEFVKYDNAEYVVLSSYNDKLLIVPFEVDESGRYTFLTSQYLFGEPYDGVFQYKQIEYADKKMK